MERFYKIAELTVKMDTHGRVAQSAIPYLIDSADSVDIEIVPDREEIKRLAPMLEDDMQEALATYRPFFIRILDFDGIFIHSSAVIMDGKAYLFTANSGTGKSTHTRIWRRVFGDDRARILNDDKPVLRFLDGEWYAYGTPWSGKSDCNLNLKVPLAGICLLQRGEENRIWKIEGKEAILELFKQTARPKSPIVRMRVLDILDKLLTQVPVWRMECNMDAGAAVVSYEAMSGKKWRE